MSTLTMAILLQLAGVFVIIAEIIIPSGGLLALIAAGLFGYSLYVVFQQISTAVGIAFVCADLIMIPALIIIGLKMLARSPATLNTELSSDVGVTSQSPELAVFLDQEGRAVTDLRPAGVALVNNKRLDVVTRGEYIDRDSEVKVIAVTGNQIIVKKIKG